MTVCRPQVAELCTPTKCGAKDESPIPPCVERISIKQEIEEIDRAVAEGNAAMLTMIVLQKCRSFDPTCDPLRAAVQQGHVGAVQLLLSSGYAADIPQGGTRPLHLALECCHTKNDTGYKMAKLLLDHGCRPTGTGRLISEQLPLFCAVRQRSAAAAELLLNAGADANEVDADGQTPLHVCADRNWMFRALAPLPQLPSFDGGNVHELIDVDILNLPPLSVPSLPNFALFDAFSPPPVGGFGSREEQQQSVGLHFSTSFPLVQKTVTAAPGKTFLNEQALDSVELDTRLCEVIELLLRNGANPSMCNRQGLKPQDLLAPCEASLRSKLQRAERWDRTRHWSLACARICARTEKRGQEDAVDTTVHGCSGFDSCVSMPHVYSYIADFL
eukprot:gb/GFBE01049003.1/.p1 GENE.gb/GFBE01049003.1/~~gb/GFBE01049003.1/.p1  ORF type:complete len:387 (+),score=60.47 gb/GFBE01049003.1/:1-1161(+)